MRMMLTAWVIAGICAMVPCAGAQAASELAWQNEAVTVSAELTRVVAPVPRFFMKTWPTLLVAGLQAVAGLWLGRALTPRGPSR